MPILNRFKFKIGGLRLVADNKPVGHKIVEGIREFTAFVAAAGRATAHRTGDPAVLSAPSACAPAPSTKATLMWHVAKCTIKGV